MVPLMANDAHTSAIANFFGHASGRKRKSLESHSEHQPHLARETLLYFLGDACPKKFAIPLLIFVSFKCTCAAHTAGPWLHSWFQKQRQEVLAGRLQAVRPLLNAVPIPDKAHPQTPACAGSLLIYGHGNCVVLNPMMVLINVHQHNVMLLHQKEGGVLTL